MSDLATSAIIAAQSQTQSTMAMQMLKMGQQQDQAVVNMLSQAVETGKAQAAAPAGMGKLVNLSV
jgi:hypothetical protein